MILSKKSQMGHIFEGFSEGPSFLQFLKMMVVPLRQMSLFSLNGQKSLVFFHVGLEKNGIWTSVRCCRLHYQVSSQRRYLLGNGFGCIQTLKKRSHCAQLLGSTINACYVICHTFQTDRNSSISNACQAGVLLGHDMKCKSLENFHIDQVSYLEKIRPFICCPQGLWHVVAKEPNSLCFLRRLIGTDRSTTHPSFLHFVQKVEEATIEVRYWKQRKNPLLFGGKW